MLQDIVAVKPLDNYKLHLRFEDGVEGIVSLKELVEFTGIFEPLHDDSYFRQVTVSDELGTIQWPNEADLDPDVLYSAITGISISSSSPADEYDSNSNFIDDHYRDQADIIQIRVFHPDLLNGSLSLRDGIRVLVSAKKMVEAAASSAIEPRSYYGGRNFNQVNEYLGNIRIGQTEKGSYIFNIISPLNASGKNQDAYYSREVVKTLFQALFSLKNISNGQENDELINQEEGLTGIIQQGVSGNLCGAIGEMGGNESGLGFAFKLIESPIFRNLANIKKEVVIAPKTISKISQIGKRLKQIKIKSSSKNVLKIYEAKKILAAENSGRTSIEGLVIKLEWAGGDQNARITIIVATGSENKNVLLEIGMQDYMIAFKANLDQVKVACSGILSIDEGDVWVLREVRDFHVIS